MIFDFLFGSGSTPPGGVQGGNASRQPSGAAFFPQPGLFDQLFIIRALILRDLRLEYQETRVGFLMEFLRPVVVILTHTWIFTVLSRYMPGQMPPVIYLIGGFLTWFSFSHVSRSGHVRGAAGLGMRWVTPMHFKIAGLVWEVSANIFLTFTLLAIAAVLGVRVPPPNVVAVVLVLSLAGLMGFGFGLVFGALAQRWPAFKGVKKVLTWFIFITSGIYSWNPQKQNILGEWYNPMLHVIAHERHAVYPSYPTDRVSLLYPIVWTFGLIILGLVLNRTLGDTEDSD